LIRDTSRAARAACSPARTSTTTKAPRATHRTTAPADIAYAAVSLFFDESLAGAAAGVLGAAAGVDAAAAGEESDDLLDEAPSALRESVM
jgi:hypothetical protein